MPLLVVTFWLLVKEQRFWVVVDPRRVCQGTPTPRFALAASRGPLSDNANVQVKFDHRAPPPIKPLIQTAPKVLTHQEPGYGNLGYGIIHQSRITRIVGHHFRSRILHFGSFPFAMSKNRIGGRPGMTLGLPVGLMVTVGSLVVCPKIVECYEERICTESHPGERAAFLGAIRWGKRAGR